MGYFLGVTNICKTGDWGLREGDSGLLHSCNFWAQQWVCGDGVCWKLVESCWVHFDS